MTQRATGNGYSWWWASHIRTKQSKWLDQNLQDMEDKVEHVLNLITKDGDSFARRAEMYYKHRPEVINFVEETVRAYRSLAERYDKLSTELQKANTTIASICPEKVTYEDDNDYTIGPSKTTKRVRKKKTKIPKPPKLPEKGVLNKYSKAVKTNPSNDVPQSDLTKDKEDDVGTSMADSLLKSCEETLGMLQEKQEKVSQTFDDAKQKLESLKGKFNPDQVNNEQSKSNVPTQENQKEIEESFESVSKNPQTVTEMAETVDKLVNKMISLETTVSSQTALTDMLKKETNDLQAQIESLEAEKAALTAMQKGNNLESKSHEVNIDDVSWLEMLLNGLEDKDDILLEDYITILKGYKATMKKLSEEEKRNRGTLSLMKSAIVKRDYKIQLLKQKLTHLQKTHGEDKVDMLLAENKDDLINEPHIVSTLEGKLRMDIDAIFDENLEYWLRFSSVFRQVHKFTTQVKEIQEELKEIRVKGLAGKSSTSMFTTDLISDIKPIYKHLKEINIRLASWLEQSKSLKDEQKMRSLALTNIEEKITQALREGVEEEDIKFSTHHAAKFKSEILNMKQENNKVNEELQAGLNHAIALNLETEKTLERLEMEFGFTVTQNQPSKGKPLGRKTVTWRSLIFGSKSKKQTPSLFACIGDQKKFSAYKGTCM